MFKEQYQRSGAYSREIDDDLEDYQKKGDPLDEICL